MNKKFKILDETQSLYNLYNLIEARNLGLGRKWKDCQYIAPLWELEERLRWKILDEQ